MIFKNAAAMVTTAQSQVGYHEGRDASGWNNHQKFSPEVPGLEWSQNQAWCHTFLSWCAMKAGLSDYYPRTASTDLGSAWFKARGQWHEYPAVGALGYLGSRGDMYHVFLVAKFDSEYVYTVEGNTNDNGSSQGDGVYNLKRMRRSSAIEGYGYPAFPEGVESADPLYVRPRIETDPPLDGPVTRPKRPVNVKDALDNFRELRRKARAKKNIKRAQKAQDQINQIKKDWPGK